MFWREFAARVYDQSMCFQNQLLRIGHHLERDNSQINMDCDTTSANMCPKGNKHMEEVWLVGHDSGFHCSFRYAETVASLKPTNVCTISANSAKHCTIYLPLNFNHVNSPVSQWNHWSAQTQTYAYVLQDHRIVACLEIAPFY